MQRLPQEPACELLSICELGNLLPIKVALTCRAKSRFGISEKWGFALTSATRERNVQNLKQEVRSGHLVTVAGTGISVAVSGNQSVSGYCVATWVGLLEHGAAYCRDIGVADDADVSIWTQQIKTTRPGFLIKTAEDISERLNRQSPGVFRGWLKDSVGALRVDEKGRALAEALASLPGVLSTLNYDGLLEQATGRHAVTWRHADRVQDVLRGTGDSAVLHLHGWWAEPESVVFGLRSYDLVRTDPHAAAVLRLLMLDRILLFVGCGETVLDPSFNLLFEWATKALREVSPRHYLLCRESELPEFHRKLDTAPWLQPLAYGEHYADLLPFLSSIAAPASASVTSILPILPRSNAGITEPSLAHDAGSDLTSKRSPKLVVHEEAIFVSYRRSDAAAQAARLAAALKQRFGRRSVFVDTESIQGGQRFPERIQASLSRARVVLVVMGSGWLAAADEDGRRRIDDSDDWVRREVAGALGSDGVTVIPVLVDAAKMPRASALPSAIQRLAERVSMPLEHTQFEVHAEQIARRIEELIPEARVLQASADLPSTVAQSSLLHLPPSTDPSRSTQAPSRTRGSYEAYPTEQVDELENLTRARDQGTPRERTDRQRRITELATKLARNVAPDDLVVGARLVWRIGNGNYGTVWLAIDEETGEQRAVKIFDTDQLGQRTSLYHFRRGVRAMQHLEKVDGRPRTIVRLHKAEPSGLAFSMDYLDGGDITDVATRGWSLETKMQLMMGVCRAVEFAHQNEVIHRDIKPANIVMRGADPVLTDFDIADLLFAKTRSAQAAGTVNYSAPEALRGTGGGKPTVDVFSLGRFLHFLLLENDPELGFEEVPQLSDIAADHPALACIIRKCTLRNPAERYPTVAALVVDLEKYRHGSYQRLGLDLSVPAIAPSPRPASRPNTALVGMGLVVLAGSLMVGAMALYNWRHQSEMALRAPGVAAAAEVPTKLGRTSVVDPMVDEKTGIEFVAIPAGTFLMGSRNDDGEREEHPQHRVTVSAFELGKYAVTNEQYRHFLDESPNLSKPPGSSGSSLGPRQPVVNVTWEDAQAFAHWAGFRLPTEAEREYAARAGTQTRYFSGDDEADLARVGWFLGNSEAHSHDVGEKAGNGLGLYDMHGNVWEWCSDWYAAYDGKAAVDPTGPEKGNARVVRGGSWGDAAQYARSASRYGDPAAYHSDTVGFRLARGPRSGK